MWRNVDSMEIPEGLAVNKEEEQKEFVLPSKGMSVLEEQKKKAVRERARIYRTSIGYDSNTDTDMSIGSEKRSYVCDNGPESCRSDTSIASRISQYSRKSALRRTPNVVATGHRNHSGISQNLDASELQKFREGAGGDMPDEVKYRQSPSFDALEKKLLNDQPCRPMSSHGCPTPDTNVMRHEPEKRPATARTHSKESEFSSSENTPRNHPKGFELSSSENTPRDHPKGSELSSSENTPRTHPKESELSSSENTPSKHPKGSELPSSENTARTFTFSGRSTPKYIPRSRRSSVVSNDSLFAEVKKIDWKKINETSEKIRSQNANASASLTSVSSFAPSITSEGGESDVSGISQAIDWIVSDQKIRLKDNDNEDSDATITEEGCKSRVCLNQSVESMAPVDEVALSDPEISTENDSKSNNDLLCNDESDSSEDGAQIRPQTSMGSQEKFYAQYPSRTSYDRPTDLPVIAIPRALDGLSIMKDRLDAQKIAKSTYDLLLQMFLTEETRNIDETQKTILQSVLQEKAKLTDKFYNMEQNGDEISYSLASNHIMDNLEEFALHPVPPGFIMKCRIFRDRKGIDKTVYPYYYLHLERDDGRKNLLMVSRKRKKSTTSYYLITTDPSNISREKVAYTGKLRSNLLGTNFSVYDGLTSFKQLRYFQPMGSKPTPSYPRREELATVFYETNILGFKGPRKMNVVIPKMLSHASRLEVRPSQKNQTMLEMIKRNDMLNLHALKNKTPEWNTDNQSYVLNFHGRVTHASVKNFKLVTKDSDGYCLLQFGRVAEDIFNMDVGYPMCPLQAFSIVLSSFDSKLACE